MFPEKGKLDVAQDKDFKIAIINIIKKLKKDKNKF